uniref:Uncharacterized protein n=1 Tax=Florenciella parvula TaxID=236787 RepID=A0A7S2B3L2_9STRA|mmetsp:Transcript_12645/g.26546  ORF Transcript_12645/g.26546 Transcript_12645/m.26546 type:complete len:130 (+) Transcript_12645:134-523(+)
MVIAAWWLTPPARPTDGCTGGPGGSSWFDGAEAVPSPRSCCIAGAWAQTSQGRCHGAVAPKADGEFPLTECQCGEPSSAFEATACSVLLMPCGSDDPRDKAGGESKAALKECKERAGRIVRRYSLSSAS